MLSSKSKLSIYLLTLLLLVATLLGYYFKAIPHYANIEFINTKNVEVHFLFQANLNKEICQENLGITSNELFAFCPNCLIKQQQCLSTLNTRFLIKYCVPEIPTEILGPSSRIFLNERF